MTSAYSLRLVPHHHKLTIGLLGGSFNPAHAGHVHISREALKRLGLDAVWWLVTPRNPLKRKDSLADYETRLAQARDTAATCRDIHVTELERVLGTRYTVETLAELKRRYPRVRFVWLMGADNLAQFHRWRRWRGIADSVPVAVFDRAPYSHAALRSKAALALGKFRIKGNPLPDLAYQCPPAWAYIGIRRHAASGTALREKAWKGAASGA